MSDIENCDHGHAAPRKILAELPDSQGGSGRHKCPVCAYHHGFQAGVAAGARRAQDAMAALSADDDATPSAGDRG